MFYKNKQFSTFNTSGCIMNWIVNQIVKTELLRRQEGSTSDNLTLSKLHLVKKKVTVVALISLILRSIHSSPLRDLNVYANLLNKETHTVCVSSLKNLTGFHKFVEFPSHSHIELCVALRHEIAWKSQHSKKCKNSKGANVNRKWLNGFSDAATRRWERTRFHVAAELNICTSSLCCGKMKLCCHLWRCRKYPPRSFRRGCSSAYVEMPCVYVFWCINDSFVPTFWAKSRGKFALVASLSIGLLF